MYIVKYVQVRDMGRTTQEIKCFDNYEVEIAQDFFEDRICDSKHAWIFAVDDEKIMKLLDKVEIHKVDEIHHGEEN